MNKCLWCGRDVNNLYCDASCQMNHAYKIGIRNKELIISKGRAIAHEKQKKHNWLNSKDSRDKLKEVQQTDEYRMKCRVAKLGLKNGMFGKKPYNYMGLSKRMENGCADRGFDWRKIKKIIKERDSYMCQHCGEKEGERYDYLQVHHLVRYSIFEDNSHDNLLTLCPKCHAKSEPQFMKINNIKKIKNNVVVHNFSVEEDETYVAENIIVHNCRSRIRYVEVD